MYSTCASTFPVLRVILDFVHRQSVLNKKKRNNLLTVTACTILNQQPTRLVACLSSSIASEKYYRSGMSRSTHNKNRTSCHPKKSLVFDEDHHLLDSGAPITEVEASGVASELLTSPANKKRKRGEETTIAALDDFASPAQKKATTTLSAVAVTPEEAERKALAKYVPKNIHKNLGYRREGASAQDDYPTTRKVYRLVCKNYRIPADFEQRRSYGPLSGMSYEERVVQGYALGKLVAKGDDVDICTSCASVGHKRFECPSLV